MLRITVLEPRRCVVLQFLPLYTFATIPSGTNVMYKLIAFCTDCDSSLSLLFSFLRFSLQEENIISVWSHCGKRHTMPRYPRTAIIISFNFVVERRYRIERYRKEVKDTSGAGAGSNTISRFFNTPHKFDLFFFYFYFLYAHRNFFVVFHSLEKSHERNCPSLRIRLHTVLSPVLYFSTIYRNSILPTSLQRGSIFFFNKKAITFFGGNRSV